MKKFKKSSRAISYTLVFSLFLNVVTFCAEISNEKQKRVDQCYEKSESLSTNIFHEEEMLKEFVSNILINSLQDGTDYPFSDNLIHFFEKILTDQKEFESKSTEQALHELLSYLLVKIEKNKAPRPDAPGNSDGSPVGDLETFSAAQILQFINALIQLVNNCCGQIQINFSGTFTVLNTLVQDFNGTFTELNQIENTILTDFNGVFTTLFACCQTSINDFNGIFTTLNEISTTITTDFNSIFTSIDSCCNELIQDFNGAFTVINELNSSFTDFSGVFTTINAFCTTNSVEFSGIFTVINELNSTVTSDFSPIFTVLNACCETLDVDLSGVFTVLNDINNTITTDFNGTFTVLTLLSEDFNALFTVLTTVSEIIDADFNGVFTALTVFCQENSVNFAGIFTVLNEISQTVITDFAGTFTALNACCSNLTTDFNGIFTSLSDIKNVVDDEFNGTFTVLSSLTVDAEGTFSILADITSVLTTDFNGVFTALNNCCQTIAVDFNGLFTLFSEINGTLTTDFNGIFTALNNCCQATELSLRGIFTTLTEIETTLTTDFNGTFTVIASLNTPRCGATPITAPMVISSPGYYCLANDIFASLVITVSNVSVNLNNHTITTAGQPGISITNALNNVDIFNGKIDSSSIGVEVINTNTVNLRNLIISNCSDSGIVLNPFCTTIAIQDCIINTVTNFGINFMNVNDVSSCQRVTLINCNGQFGIGTNGSLSTSLFEDCSIINCNSVQAQFTPFNLPNGTSNQLIRCSVKNIQNSVGAIAAFNIGSNATVLNECKVQGLNAETNANGYIVNNTGVLIQNCLAVGINSGGLSFGFNLTGTSAIMESCLAQQISSPVIGNAFGISVTDAGFSLADCYAFHTTGTGVALLLLSPGSVITDGMLFNCGANNNSGNGFGYVSFPFTYVANCTAFNNSLFGFEAEFVGAGQYGCFASGNAGGNYSANVPNVQPASLNAGVFARGNNFI